MIALRARIATAAAVVLVLLGAGLLALVLRDDGEEDTTSRTTTTQEEEEARSESRPENPEEREVKPAPVITGRGTLDVSRSIGRLATAQARGLIKKPSVIRVRVSAAPKQTVTVDWQLSCYKATRKTSRTKVDVDRYRTVPLDTRALPLPMTAPDECTATVAAQLTKTVGSGRVKVAVIAG